MGGDGRFAEFQNLRDDYAWGVREIVRSEDPAGERQRRLEEYHRLNAGVAERRDELAAQLAGDYPNVAAGPPRQRRQLVAEDAEIHRIEEALGATRERIHRVGNPGERQRLLAAFERENAPQVARRAELLKDSKEARREAAELAGMVRPSLPPEPVLGTPEEVELIGLRKSLGERMRQAAHPDGEELDPSERQRRLEQHNGRAAAEMARLRELRQTVGDEISRRAQQEQQPQREARR